MVIQVRVFSYLIGREMTFAQNTKWIACNNKGEIMSVALLCKDTHTKLCKFEMFTAKFRPKYKKKVSRFLHLKLSSMYKEVFSRARVRPAIFSPLLPFVFSDF